MIVCQLSVRARSRCGFDVFPRLKLHANLWGQIYQSEVVISGKPEHGSRQIKTERKNEVSKININMENL
jgi:hypothetical protein